MCRSFFRFILRVLWTTKKKGGGGRAIQLYSTAVKGLLFYTISRTVPVFSLNRILSKDIAYAVQAAGDF